MKNQLCYIGTWTENFTLILTHNQYIVDNMYIKNVYIDMCIIKI